LYGVDLPAPVWFAVTAGRSGWCRRKLNCGQQALLVLVHLGKGETFAELGAGFGVGTRDRLAIGAGARAGRR